MKRFVLALAVAVSAAAFVASPAFAQKSKDTLRFPLNDAEAGLDPYLIPGSFNNTWEASVFDNLLGFDPKKVDFVPLLAKSWTQPEPTVYEYELRDDVKWHDGQPFTADDVVYTINYLIDPKVPLRFKGNWAWIKSVEKLGPYKVRITSKAPAPDGMMWMAFNTSIFPKHIHDALANKADFAGKPIGTGPLKIAKIDKNTGIVVERNADFKTVAGKKASGVGRVVSEPVPDFGTLTAKFLIGEVDVARDLPADQIVALRDSGKAEFTLSAPTLGYSFLGFPTVGAQNVKALADPRVRLAMIKAIDRDAVVRATFGDLAKDMTPVEGLCAKEQLGCGYTKLTPAYDPAGAKKLLAEAGYADGFDVSISCFPSGQTEVTAITGMLRAVGIRATVRTHPTAARLQMMASGKVDIGYYGWNGGGMFEVSGQIVRHFLSKEYDDPILTKMAEDTMTMMNDAERRVAVAKVMDYANEKSYLFPMVSSRVSFTHTHEVALDTSEIRATQVNPHDFAWK
jgi:peptide/nickel transport system substrate-binding protein